MNQNELFWLLGMALLTISMSALGAYWATPKHSRRDVGCVPLFAGGLLIYTVVLMIWEYVT